MNFLNAQEVNNFNNYYTQEQNEKVIICNAWTIIRVRYYSACCHETICVTAVDPKRRRLTPRFISAVPSVSLMRAGSHFDGEIFDATYTGHKTFDKREGRMALGTNLEREECSLTLETPVSWQGSVSPAWITRRAANVLRRYEGIVFPHDEWANKPSCLIQFRQASFFFNLAVTQSCRSHFARSRILVDIQLANVACDRCARKSEPAILQFPRCRNTRRDAWQSWITLLREASSSFEGCNRRRPGSNFHESNYAFPRHKVAS